MLCLDLGQIFEPEPNTREDSKLARAEERQNEIFTAAPQRIWLHAGSRHKSLRTVLRAPQQTLLLALQAWCEDWGLRLGLRTPLIAGGALIQTHLGGVRVKPRPSRRSS